MSSSRSTHALPELFDALRSHNSIDEVDWLLVTRFAEKWKLSIADALLDLHIVDETMLARALAKAHHITYIPHTELECDFTEIDFETFEDLLSVGAAPLTGFKLAICNPYDDHRGNLGNRLCQREMVVTERSHLFEALRNQGMREWLLEDEE
jgi:hypothetical protein